MLTRFNASGCHGLRLAWVAWFCLLPDHGDAICPPVARAVATDHPQKSGFAGAARVDLRAKVLQAFGGGLDLTRAELDRARVHLNAAGVSVVEHRAVQRLGQHPQVADHQRREQHIPATPNPTGVDQGCRRGSPQPGWMGSPMSRVLAPPATDPAGEQCRERRDHRGSMPGIIRIWRT